MLKTILLIAILVSAFTLIGCTDSPKPEPEPNMTTEEQPDDIPMPTEEDVNNAESPEFNFG
ncbi:hypothetical protein K8R43_02620 [archaeon]|nr:hypothetical protein [archaeon]